MANLRERRMRLKSSKIFSASATKGMSKFAGNVAQSNILQEEEAEDEDLDEERETIDLREEQSQANDEDDEMDEFDLLDASIDAKDIRTQNKIANLEQEIEEEKRLI